MNRMLFGSSSHCYLLDGRDDVHVDHVNHAESLHLHCSDVVSVHDICTGDALFLLEHTCVGQSQCTGQTRALRSAITRSNRLRNPLNARLSPGMRTHFLEEFDVLGSGHALHGLDTRVNPAQATLISLNWPLRGVTVAVEDDLTIADDTGRSHGE